MFLEVEGFVADDLGGRWKQLVWQDKRYLPPSKRESLGHAVFSLYRGHLAAISDEEYGLFKDFSL